MVDSSLSCQNKPSQYAVFPFSTTQFHEKNVSRFRLQGPVKLYRLGLMWAKTQFEDTKYKLDWCTYFVTSTKCYYLKHQPRGILHVPNNSMKISPGPTWQSDYTSTPIDRRTKMSLIPESTRWNLSLLESNKKETNKNKIKNLCHAGFVCPDTEQCDN